VDTTELEVKLSAARNETQLELLQTVSKGERANKASLNAKADSARLEQYIEATEARRQQVRVLPLGAERERACRARCDRCKVQVDRAAGPHGHRPAAPRLLGHGCHVPRW
jgi:hypothetical protein